MGAVIDARGAPRRSRRRPIMRTPRSTPRTTRSASHSRVEPHLVGEGAPPGESLPVADPERLTLPERGNLRRETGARGEASNPGHAANAERALYGERWRSGGPSGSTCHQVCPAAASQSTNRYASGPSRPPGSEVMWSWTPLERGSSITLRLAVQPSAKVFTHREDGYFRGDDADPPTRDRPRPREHAP